jgi:hypothetical protein
MILNYKLKIEYKKKNADVLKIFVQNVIVNKK